MPTRLSTLLLGLLLLVATACSKEEPSPITIAPYIPPPLAGLWKYDGFKEWQYDVNMRVTGWGSNTETITRTLLTDSTLQNSTQPITPQPTYPFYRDGDTLRFRQFEPNRPTAYAIAELTRTKLVLRSRRARVLPTAPWRTPDSYWYLYEYRYSR